MGLNFLSASDKWQSDGHVPDVYFTSGYGSQTHLPRAVFGTAWSQVTGGGNFRLSSVDSMM